MRSRLAPGGVVITNVIGSIERATAPKLFRSMLKTYRTVFPTVVVHPVVLPGERGDDLLRNLIIVATDSPAPSKSFLRQRWADVRERYPTAPSLTAAIRNRHDRPIPTDDVPALTDDYAPTDALLLIE